MNTPRTLAIVIQYGSYENLRICLERLTYSGKHLVDVCVVDNNPSDNRNSDFYTQYFPKAQVIYPQENLGFAGGCNAGLRKFRSAKYEFAFILNNDAHIQNKDIAHLENVLDSDKSIGLVGPVVHDTLTNMLYFGMRINWKRGRIEHNKMIINPDAIYDVDLVEGCGMMIRRDVLREIQGLDERFFLYWEDADLSIRIQNAGFRTVITGKVCMEHTPSQSTGQGSPLKEYYMTRNALLFFSLHKKNHFACKFLLLRMLKSRIRRSLRNLLQGNLTIGEIQFFAVWDFLCNRLNRSPRINHTQ